MMVNRQKVGMAKQAIKKTPVKESSEQLRARTRKILALLTKAYPDAWCTLNYKNPFQLLISTILSAQCTDERVNALTPSLFKRYPTPRSFAEASLEELEQAIKPTGFYRNKARNIQGACRLIQTKYKGQVPQTMGELLELPGVARKTANVVMGTAFGKTTGVVVDTHVNRVAQRLGVTGETDSNKIEQDLMHLLPHDQWVTFSHRTILHGRQVCTARKPKCGECVLNQLCPSAFKV